MSLNTDLQTLKTNIEGVKSTLYTNLTNKGVTNISESDTLSTLAGKVSEITVGEGGSGGSAIDFSSIGYDSELSSEMNEKINADVAYSKTLLDAWNPSRTSANNLYSGDIKLVYAPNIDTRNVTSMTSMFQDCSNIISVPELDTSNVTNMNSMFYRCSKLTSVQSFDTSNVTSMVQMFCNCSNIKTVPAFNTSNVTNMYGTFSGCTSITSVPTFNTSNVTNMDFMLYNCSRLTLVPLFDTSNVTSMRFMFYSCSRLTTIPAFNTSNVTDMYCTFYYCESLTTIPAFDTSKVNNFDSIFAGCHKLTTIEGISFKSFKDSTMENDYLYGMYINSSTRKAVFKDIGYQSTAKQFNTSNITNWGVNSDEIPDARQSLIDSLITYSFDRATAGYPTCTITLSTNTKALLTSDEIAQITAKGFTIA